MTLERLELLRQLLKEADAFEFIANDLVEVTIEVSGGVVQDVTCPNFVKVVVIDYDNTEEDLDADE